MIRRAEKMLKRQILPFWLGLKDPRGGFYGGTDGQGRIIPDSDRGAVLNARILWTFSAAFRILGEPQYAGAARWALEYFLQHFVDGENGGVFWCLDSDGVPNEDKKQLYALSFAIYGLSEAFLALGDQRALSAAVGIFSLIERHFHDPLFGGYLEAFKRDFSPLDDMSLSDKDINASKTMNSHIHLMEAYAALYRVWPDASLEWALRELFVIMGKRMTGSDGHLGLYFDSDWTVLPGEVSPGHDIETSWLLIECASVLNDQTLMEQIVPVSLRLGNAGLGAGDIPSGEWWVYAETVVGNIYMHLFHGDTAALDRASRCFEFIEKKLVDREHGEWYWGLLPDGTPDRDSPKAGFWKCPYHNSRMCLEILTKLGHPSKYG